MYDQFKEAFCLTSLGYIDRSGKIAIDTSNYTPVGDFSNGLACVCKDEKYGYINTKGKIVIYFKLDFADLFSEGVALVNKDGKKQFINKNGETVIDRVEVDELIFSDNKYDIVLQE